MASESLLYYSNILNYVSIADMPEFELGILRNGCYMLQRKHFEEALEFFKCCSQESPYSIISDFGMAKALYGVSCIDLHHFDL